MESLEVDGYGYRICTAENPVSGQEKLQSGVRLSCVSSLYYEVKSGGLRTNGDSSVYNSSSMASRGG